MAALHCPPPGLPTPSSSLHGRTTPPAAPKLRDSCHACAVSKLKCFKEKPTCSRCARRGITCEYVATKRAGRKAIRRTSVGSENRVNDNASNITNTNTMNKSSSSSSSGNGNGNGNNKNNHNSNIICKNSAPLPVQSPTATQLHSFPAVMSAPIALASPGAMHPSPEPISSGSSEILPDFFSPMDQTDMFSATMDMSTDLGDFFASPLSFPMPELSDVDGLGQTTFFPTGMDGGNNGFEDAVFSELLALSNPTSPPGMRPVSCATVQNYQEICRIDSSCSCLVQALGLFKLLSPGPSNACITSIVQEDLDKTAAAPSIESVIAKNENTIKAVSTMLKCSCSQDGYLLTIMSLIVFKVLGWYAAAAWKKPLLRDPAVVAGSYGVDGDDTARMTAQLVLSELHHVRRLVSQLSSKLKVQAAKTGGVGGRVDTPNSDFYGIAESEITSPLSAVMLDQLDADLRKRLKALSSEILEWLRRL